MNSNNLKYLTTALKERTHTHKHQFYFDANDIIFTIRGIQRFYESASGTDFQKNIFNEENTVIHSLLISGFLGESIKLLPPHQAELSDKLRKGALFKKVNKYISDQFLKNDLDFFEKLKEIKNISINEKSHDYLGSWVNQKGKEIFNAIYNSYKLTYEQRLIELHENNILKIENYDLEDIKIYNQGLFDSLSDAFNKDSKRGTDDYSENNFRDVIALMYLARKVKAFNKDHKKPIPVFFDSQNFAKLIPQNLLKEHFTIKYNGTESLALRTQSYFRIYALVDYNPPKKDKFYEDFLDRQHIIGNIIVDLKELSSIEAIIGTKNSLEDRKKELDKKINEYFNFDFFNLILIRTFTNEIKILDDILNDSDEKAFDYDAIEILKQKVETILGKFNKEINELFYNSAHIYKLIEQQFKYVLDFHTQLKLEKKALDIFNNYSLFRFFIPEKYTENLNLIFSEDGILSSNPSTYRVTLTSIWNLYYRTINNNSKLEEYELFDLYATFWILNLHELVIKFNFDYTKLHHSLLMLKGACLNRAILELKGKNKLVGVHVSSIKRIIQILYKRLKETNTHDSAFGEINIVISYLYFLLWIIQGNKLTLEGGKELSKIESTAYNQKAISFAKEAYNYFNANTSENNPYRIYSLNIYIYFIIDTSTINHFLEIKELRQEFIRQKGKIKDWHFRYDDTIARNFHRLAMLQEKNEEKLEILQKAIDILKETTEIHKVLQSRDINEVREYLTSLIDLKADLKISDKQLN